MRTDPSDRWLLPSRQADFPARDVISDAVLHARREATFLVLVTITLVATSATVVLGVGQTIDVGATFGLDLPTPLIVPLGALALPVALCATSIACDLYGARRATALAIASALASFAFAGLAILGAGDDALVPALALAGAILVAQLANVLVVALSHGPWPRAVVAAVVGQATGWAGFGAAIVLAGADRDAALALGAGAWLAASAAAIALAVPAFAARRALRVFLRTGDLARAPDYASGPVSRRLPQATIVDDDPRPARRRQRSKRVSVQPFSSAELRFFTEGEEMTEPADAT
ncbi:MAG TPA: hypothetical protein VLX92_08885 [Kofleriaceae bacterium]|nr:hypothetical protein [Kofleriaceae bacterium]